MTESILDLRMSLHRDLNIVTEFKPLEVNYRADFPKFTISFMIFSGLWYYTLCDYQVSLPQGTI